ncbi:MAG: RES domain-containing protein [Pseudomonadota bacterium]|nr:RES domain-containing protein [Pseudomonadota bacterium]
MNAYRLGKKQFINDLSGTGAALYGGRWNYPGYRVIYASESIPLAILEYIVKAGAVEDELSDLKIAFLNFANDVSISEVDIQHLPENWNNYPAPEELKKIGTNWLLSVESLILKIPAISAPESCNLLINPIHPEFNKIELAKIIDYHADIRLDKKRTP